MLVGSLTPDQSAELVSRAWPLERLDDALLELGRASRLVRLRPLANSAPPAELGAAEAAVRVSAAGRWLERLAGELELEAEPLTCLYSETERLLSSLAPGLVLLPGSESRCLVVLASGSGGRTITVLRPDGRRERLKRELVRDALCAPLEQPLLPELEPLLQTAGVPYRRLRRARQALLRERLARHRLGPFWSLRPSPAASFRRQLASSGLLRSLSTIAVAHALLYLLFILSWWLVGRGVLAGRLDPGWLTAWVLLLVALVPLRLTASWLEGRFAIRAGALLKRRLLFGALQLEPEEVRHQGSGQLLGRVVESEAVESLTLGGGFSGLVAAIELAGAAAVLALGAGGGLHLQLLAGWVLLTLALAWSYYRGLTPWSEARLEMTGELVEAIAGYRTRLAQEPPAKWHEAEDRELARYLELSRVLDARSARLQAMIARGWLVVGVVGLAPVFVAGDGSRGRLAVAIGGILLAHRAFAGLAHGLTQLLRAGVAWRQVSPLFQAARRGRSAMLGFRRGERAPVCERPGATSEEPVLEARRLEFAYPKPFHPNTTCERKIAETTWEEPLLRIDRLKLSRGEQVLLQGASGSGKSTLVALLAGLRTPRSGLLLQRGMDRASLGADDWGRGIAAVPQFHENHVLSETLAFNLLMGRRWPPRADDLKEAETICRELGLGPLLDHMPARLFQRVGESGWQLSHGERSRLFIARALLQRAELVILDESFAALDPQSLGQALECVRRRAPTLLVVAHP